VKGVDGMIEPNIFNFYCFGADLKFLGQLEAGTKLRDNPRVIQELLNACNVASWFGTEELCKTYLTSSGTKLVHIKDLIQMMLQSSSGGAVAEAVSAYEAKLLADEVKEFETLLSDELNKLPFFFLEDEKIGNLSVAKLRKGASDGYPSEVRIRLTVACKSEIDESAKCLVFERSTASGFHILRSVELTIKQYLQSVPGFVMPPINRQNWGEYLKLLKENNASREVTDQLHNIIFNYRNPLMHPEDTLDLPEAVSLFAVAQSMNEMLITDMLERKLIQ
jgi:hypothetical protein